jgi:hypothetical protein
VGGVVHKGESNEFQQVVVIDDQGRTSWEYTSTNQNSSVMERSMCAPAPESFYFSPFPGAHCPLGLELLADSLPRVVIDDQGRTSWEYTSTNQNSSVMERGQTLSEGSESHGAEQKERVPGDVGLDAAESDSGSKWEVSYTRGIASSKLW